MGKKQRFSELLIVLLGIILCSVFFLSYKVTNRTSNSLLDGDASAEMVLSHHLSETRQLISKDWYYSTELRVLYGQIIFAFLFNFLSDWSAVRLYGTLILQIILMLSFVYMMRQVLSKEERNRRTIAILTGCILLLVPYSLNYGEIVLYHVYYIPNIAISFFLVGLLCAAVNARENQQTAAFRIDFIFLVILSAISTLSGYRQIVILFLPLFLTAAIRFLHSERQNRRVEKGFRIQDFGDRKSDFYNSPADPDSEDKNGYRVWLKLILLMFVSAAAGLAVNLFVLKRIFTFRNYSDIIYLTNLNAEKIIEQLNFILSQTGYKSSVSLLSVSGILSVCALLTGFFVMTAGKTALFSKKQDEIPVEIICGILLPGIICVFLSDLLTDIVSYERYYLPVMVWMIPIMCTKIRKGNILANAVFSFCILCLFANGLYNMAVFLGRAEDETTVRKFEFVSRLRDAADYIDSNHYDYGITTFWESAVITEMTDGIPVSNVGYSENAIIWNNWLTLESIRHEHYDKAFMLISNSDRALLDYFESPFDIHRAFEGKYYTVYDVSDADSMIHFIDQFGAKAYPRIINYR